MLGRIVGLVGLASMGPLVFLALGSLAVAGLAAPQTAWAAEGGGFKTVWDQAWRVINFLILAVIIFKVAKEPARNFFGSKRREAEETLTSLEEARVQAEAELKEIEARLDAADKEAREILKQFTQAAEFHRRKILAEAAVSADLTVEQAKLAAQAEIDRAKRKLAVESGRAIVARASALLKSRLDSEDHFRLVDEALNRMESVKAA